MYHGTIYDQSAVIPFRLDNNRFKILLITSINSRKWIIPKGVIEDHLSPQESARKEAFEEAGVTGEVLDILIGEYRYNKWGGTCNVRVYPLYVTNYYDDWPEAGQRKRQWVSINKAVELVEKEEIKQLFKKLTKEYLTIQSLIEKSS